MQNGIREITDLPKNKYQYKYINKTEFKSFWLHNIYPYITKFNKQQYTFYIMDLQSKYAEKAKSAKSEWVDYYWDLSKWINYEIISSSLSEEEWEQCKLNKTLTSEIQEFNLSKIHNKNNI